VNSLARANTLALRENREGIGLHQRAHPATSKSFERSHDEAPFFINASDHTAIVHLSIFLTH
jgi:hypothetical protein